ncbi:hypothetical protein G5B39_17930 (plasmid) [Rhodobacteraceae bacterium SC52]|nr:hypothetical protein G5B39_17930 [Rhodobacteraceae bacterium SC52]
MTRNIAAYFKGTLAVALAVGIVLSANARSVTHDLTALAKIVADHQAEIEEHGHAHEDIVDLMHAYQGHSHEIADHDHNIAFLPTREAVAEPLPTSASWKLAHNGMPDRRDHKLDRPPRM